MPRGERAKQFAPFDALKGLQQALRLKEYEHERVEKGDLSEEDLLRLSTILSNLEKNTLVEVQFFFDGHIKTKQGKGKVDLVNQVLALDNIKIDFLDLIDIRILV